MDSVRVVMDVSTGEATDAVEKLNKALDKTEGSAKKAETSVKGTAQASKHLEEGAGKADSVLQGLASGLDVVDERAGAALRTVGDLAGGTEALARAGTLSLGPLALVAAAVAALGAAWWYLNKQLKEATEEQRHQAELASQQQGYAEQLRMLKLQNDAINDEVGARKLAEEQLKNQARAMAGLAQEQAKFEELQRAFQTDPSKENTKALDDQKDRLDAAKTAAGQFHAELKRGQEAQALYKWGAEDTTKAIKEQTEALKEYQDQGPPEWASGGYIQGVPVQGGSMSQWDLYQGRHGAENAAAIEAGAEANAAAAEGGGGIGGKVMGLAGSKGGQAALGLVQGNTAGLLAAAGPVGMAAAGVAAIGSMGKEGVRDQLMGFKDSLIEGLRILPEILVEVIPEFIHSLIADLIPALIDAAPQLFMALLVKLPIALGAAIIDGLADALRKILDFIPGVNSEKGQGFLGWKKAWNWVAPGEGMDVATGEKHQTGGYVGRTGLALVHAGEAVIPPSGVGTQAQHKQALDPIMGALRAQAGAGGLGGIHVNGSIYSGLDTLIRELERRVGAYSLSTSTVMGT